MLGSIPIFLRQRDLLWGSIPKVIFWLKGISPFTLNPVLFMSLFGHAMSNFLTRERFGDLLS